MEDLFSFIFKDFEAYRNFFSAVFLCNFEDYHWIV